MTIETLSDLLFHVRGISAGETELLSTDGGGRGSHQSTADFVASVHALALALEAEGVRLGDRVAILSEPRAEGHVVDFACHLLGAPVVPLGPDLDPERVAYGLRNSASGWVFYSDTAKRDLLLGLRGALTSMPRAIAMDGDAAMEGEPSLTRLLGHGTARRAEHPIERFRNRVKAADAASMLYSEGGRVDGLDHGGAVADIEALGANLEVRPGDLAMSLLPQGSKFQRTFDYLCFHRGASIRYAPSVADVPAALRRGKPTLLAASPPLFREAYRWAWGAETGGPRKRVRWAVDVGERYAASRREGIIGPVLAAQRRLAERMVYQRFRETLGGRLRLAVVGGGRLEGEAAAFFEAVGIPVFQAPDPD
ncbi:MAG: AMP-binding protein [Acidobacteriota bacterium]